VTSHYGRIMTSLHPEAAGLDLTAEIAAHSTALAAAADGNLNAAVEHCPGWTVADLVAHTFEVHWFWNRIAAELLQAPPADDSRPARPADEALLTEFRAGAQRLVETLSAADQSTQVWTWAPSQQNIAFITRHQVQEAAVHRWDAEHAAGRDVSIAAATAVDSIEEFLTFSVSSVTDHPATPRPSLDGAFVLTATDVAASWTVKDDELPGTLTFVRGGAAGLPTVSATASDLLLWLYGRVEIEAPDQDLIQRFRGLSFTD
jgi:uncharacterized protein (TIGR03083 family)